MRRFCGGVSLLLLWASSSWASVSYESLTFLKGDGHRYLNYATTRSKETSYNVFLNKADDLSEYLYVNPHRYEYDNESSLEHNLIRFQQGSYALMSEGDYIDINNPKRSLVTIDSEGIYTLSTWDGTRASNGHFGIWNTPINFDNFAAAWVLPEDFEVVDYTSNRQGDWVVRGSTVAFFATDTNDLTFEIRYRPKRQQTYSAIRHQLEDVDAIDVEQRADGITVVFKNEILFPSGSAKLSDDGKGIIADVASQLPAHDYDIIVEGHTDDIPIRGALQRRFPTNWELSAERALNVVHALADAGVDPARLEARALGPYHPRVPNDTAENRSANRRIELTIQ